MSNTADNFVRLKQVAYSFVQVYEPKLLAAVHEFCVMNFALRMGDCQRALPLFALTMLRGSGFISARLLP
jgi:hypothetical protein